MMSNRLQQTHTGIASLQKYYANLKSIDKTPLYKHFE